MLNIKKAPLIFVIIILITIKPIFYFSQTECEIVGKVIKNNGQPLTYVNILLQSTSQNNLGTTSNSEGEFKFRLNDNVKQIKFSYIGYKTKVIENKNLCYQKDSLKVILTEESFELDTFQIIADAEDPAYPIIRKAKTKRKYYKELVETFSGKLYMKASARLEEIPEKLPTFLFGGNESDMPDSSDLRLLFITESVSEIDYLSPNYFKEKMIASRVSGMQNMFSFNRASDVYYNFYDNTLKLSNFSDRDFISPISNNCFFYYKYSLQGSFYEENKKIYKIKVIPKRKIDPVFKGEIFIEDETFRIHQINLTITKDAQLEFIDSVNLKQTFQLINDSIQIPFTLEVDALFKIFGFAGRYVALGQLSEAFADSTISKKDFGNQVFETEISANKKDSVYWDKNRNEVLTEEEEETYFKADSTYQVENSKPYLDSVDKAQNKFKIVSFFFSNYKHQNSFDSTYWEISNILLNLKFNTVEGWLYEPYFNWYKRKGKGKFNYVYGSTKIPFGNQTYRGSGKLGFIHNFNQTNRSRLGIEGGIYSDEINSTNPVSPFLNTFYSLIGKDNYLKLYEKHYLKAYYQQEVTNGFYAKINGEYIFNRKDLYNQYDNSWTKKDKPYTPNLTNNGNYNNGFIFSVNLSYTPNMKYEKLPYYKRNLGSVWPTFYGSYTKGLGFNNTSFNYDQLEFGIGKSINLKVLGVLDFDVNYGTFINTKKMSFYDYKHFRGNRIHIMTEQKTDALLRQFRSRLNQFYSLDYYNYSTNSSYIELHTEHRFKGFILNKMPLIRKLKWKSIFGLNYLNTDFKNNYFEFVIGLDNILKLIRIDVPLYINDGNKLKADFRIRLKANL